MKIYSTSNSNSRQFPKIRNFLTIPAIGIIFITSTLVCAYLLHQAHEKLFPHGIKLALWEKANDYGFGSLRDDIRLRDSLGRLPDYVSRILRPTNVPEITIDIKFKHLQKLHKKRAEALRKGYLSTDNNDYVPAKIGVNGRSVKVKLRLKGDNLDHLYGEKWSMRVHVKGKDHVFGLRRFSIQSPKTRAFQGEILFHETLRQFNILTPKYFFVNVVINGNDIGMMAIEEHFSKELLERNGRKEGVIVKFNETYLWKEKDFANAGPFKEGPFENYMNTNIEAFRSSKLKNSPALSEQFAIAVGLLRSFMQNKLKASDVFDVEQLGSYLASAELWGAKHEILWPNLRFYLNPLTMKLEPIAFDAALQLRIPPGTTITHERHIKKMLDDPIVADNFHRKLKFLIGQVKDSTLIDQLKSIEMPVVEKLQTEFFMLESFNYSELDHRADLLPSKKQPDLDLSKIPAYTHPYLITEGRVTYLELQSTLPVQTEVHSIFWIDKSGKIIPFETNHPLEYPILLEETPIGSLPRSIRIPYKTPAGDENYQLVVESSIRGYETHKETKAIDYFPPLVESPLPHNDTSDLLNSYPFLSLEVNTITVQKGQWDIEDVIVIPEDYKLIITAGTTLHFAENAALIVFGSTVFEGEPGNPVVLDSLSAGQSWQGIAIFNAKVRSFWSNVIVKNTSGINLNSWKLTGGTTFYKSDINMLNTRFIGHNGEDALNIVHSNFNINNITIENTTSDALDSDFCTGKVTGGTFREIGTKGGGDGIDVSGSNVSVEGTTFIGINDKAISVGEQSQLIAKNLLIQDSGVAAASKDLSNLVISDSVIENPRTAAFMAYTKKPEYGPASITAINNHIKSTKTKALAQTGNRIEIDGKVVKTQDLDIEKLYQTIMKGSRK